MKKNLAEMNRDGDPIEGKNLDKMIEKSTLTFERLILNLNPVQPVTIKTIPDGNTEEGLPDNLYAKLWEKRNNLISMIEVVDGRICITIEEED